MGSDIAELLERVEKATGPDMSLDDAICIALGVTDCDDGSGIYTLRGRTQVTPPGLTSSLDAALALVEEKLPGWDWSVRHSVSADGDVRYANAVVWVPSDPRDEESPRHWANHNHSPALALLSALLRALAPVRGTDK